MTLFVVNDVSINTFIKKATGMYLHVRIEKIQASTVAQVVQEGFEQEDGCYVSLEEELYFKFTEDLNIGLCFNTDRSELNLPVFGDDIILVSIDQDNELEFSRVTVID